VICHVLTINNFEIFEAINECLLRHCIAIFPFTDVLLEEENEQNRVAKSWAEDSLAGICFLLNITNL